MCHYGTVEKERTFRCDELAVGTLSGAVVIFKMGADGQLLECARKQYRNKAISCLQYAPTGTLLAAASDAAFAAFSVLFLAVCFVGVPPPALFFNPPVSVEALFHPTCGRVWAPFMPHSMHLAHHVMMFSVGYSLCPCSRSKVPTFSFIPLSMADAASASCASDIAMIPSIVSGMSSMSP